MKKILLFIVILLVLSSVPAIAEQTQESGGFFGWLSKLFGKKQTEQEQATLESLPEEIVEEEVSQECNVVVCISGTKEIHCTGSFTDCQSQYERCRIVSCDIELASEAPCMPPENTEETCKETRNLCTVELKTGNVPSLKKLICVGNYNDCRLKYGDCECGAPAEEEKCCCLTAIGAYQQISKISCNNCMSEDKCAPSQTIAPACDEQKHTCYHETDPVQTEDQYLPPVMMAFTCQGSYADCAARYGKCECGVKTDACSEKENTCRKGRDFFECAGTFDFCLRKYEDCTCGKVYECDKGYHACYLQGKELSCNGDYVDCVRRHDKCLCGRPGMSCLTKNQRCYDSAQTTTTYVEPIEANCTGNFYDCAKEHDWCECGDSQQGDYSCLLAQHTCWKDNGSMVICNGDLDSCESKYSRCDCGITNEERQLAAE
ncbi:MAG: hypothetical protein KJ574_05255 [Nanoarchaeota archaeon]|nr:hypothetical protein [Nanoarchaeota archaeon]